MRHSIRKISGAYLQVTGCSNHRGHGVSAEVMQTFLRSCAGYSVISYILGECQANCPTLFLTGFYAPYLMLTLLSNVLYLDPL